MGGRGRARGGAAGGRGWRGRRAWRVFLRPHGQQTLHGEGSSLRGAFFFNGPRVFRFHEGLFSRARGFFQRALSPEGFFETPEGFSKTAFSSEFLFETPEGFSRAPFSPEGFLMVLLGVLMVLSFFHFFLMFLFMFVFSFF